MILRQLRIGHVARGGGPLPGVLEAAALVRAARVAATVRRVRERDGMGRESEASGKTTVNRVR